MTASFVLLCKRFY